MNNQHSSPFNSPLKQYYKKRLEQKQIIQNQKPIQQQPMNYSPINILNNQQQQQQQQYDHVKLQQKQIINKFNFNRKQYALQIQSQSSQIYKPTISVQHQLNEAQNQNQNLNQQEQKLKYFQNQLKNNLQTFKDEQIRNKNLVINIYIIIFIIIQVYYAISYKLQWFIIFNLLFIMFWITANPFHLYNITVSKNINYEILNIKIHHFQVNRKIFKYILINFIIFDLILIKILSIKLNILPDLLNKIFDLKQVFNKYFDMNFVNILQKILVQAIGNTIPQQINNQQNISSDQNYSLFLYIIKLIGQLFQWIYVILAVIIKFTVSFTTQILFKQQHLIYLLLILISYLIIQNYFQLNDYQKQEKQKNSILQKQFIKQINENNKNKEKDKKKQKESNTQHQIDKNKIYQSIPKSQKALGYKKRKRKDSSSDSSIIIQQNINKKLLMYMVSPVYKQFSKYLSLFSLPIIYFICFFASQTQSIFWGLISIKKCWVLIICIYGIFIIQKCKKNYNSQKFTINQFWFKLILFILSFLIIILILNDFISLKSSCQNQSEYIFDVINCFQEKSKYFHHFHSIFYNSHIQNSSKDHVNVYILPTYLEYILKIIILINLRYYKLTLFQLNKTQKRKINRKQSIQDQIISNTDNNILNQSNYSVGPSINSSHSFTVRKKLYKENKSLEINTLVLYISSILIMTITDSITNIFVLVGVYLMIPLYKDQRFRFWLSLGIIGGLFLQPNQFLYFILLMLMLYVRGQDIEFSNHSYWVAVQFSKFFILFSKVSVINLLMGLIQSSKLVLLCISFRIVLNYNQIISVFMGTQQNYNQTFFYNLIPSSMLINIILWIYMIILKLYSPNFVNKFSHSNITDIFKQYPLLQKFQFFLKILKIIQLLSYIVIQIIVLTQRPSIIVFIRLFLHVIIASIDLLRENAYQTLKVLWKINRYASLFIVFLKYFYLLNHYQNLSGWLIALLKPISKHWQIIGLWQSSQDSIFSLLIMFLPDLCIIVLSMIVQFTLQVKIYQNYRSIVIKEENLKFDEQNSSLQSKKQIKDNPILNQKMNQIINNNPIEQNFKKQKNHLTQLQIEEQKVTKNIHYLYVNYIKQVSFKFTQKSLIGSILADFLYDIYFIGFCFIYFFLENNNQFNSYWLNLPHFIIAFYIFMSQQDRKIPKKTFIYSIIYTCITILLLYIRYLKSYITEQANISSFYNLTDIVNKYILFLFSCLFYKIHMALKNQFLILNKNIDRQNNKLFTLLMPQFEKGVGYKFLKQISIIWINFIKSAILALFISNFFTSMTNSFFNIIAFFYLLAIVNKPHFFGYLIKQDTLKLYWVYPMLLTYCLSLWNCSFIGYAGIIAVRLYIIFYMQYELHVNFLFCEYVTQTQKNLIQQVDKRFQNVKTIDKMSIIPQEKQGVSKISFSQNSQQNKQWILAYTYKTIIMFLPHICLLLIIISEILLYKNLFLGFLFVVILGILFLNIKFFEKNWIINVHMKKLIQCIFVLLFIANFIQFQQQKIIENKNQVWVKLGIFFLYLGYIYYVHLTFRSHKQNDYLFLIPKSFKINFLQERTQQAINYWTIKSQFVSQLGCQIHNEKKLIKLKKYYQTKQNIARKVQKLIQQIQKRGRQNLNEKNKSNIDFEIIDRILETKDQQTHFELFSNMLITLSLQDLQYCLEMLNQYYKPNTKYKFINAKKIENSRINSNLEEFRNINLNITEQIKQIRKKVLNIYHGSIQISLKQYKIQKIREILSEKNINNFQNPKSITKQYSKVNQIEQYQQSQESQQLVNLEKIILMNEKNMNCIQRIHTKSLEIHWIWRKIIQNSQIISLVIVTCWNFVGGVYTIPTNITIFSWALVLQTKTTVFFWSFILLYTSFIIFCKISLPSLPSIPILEFIFYYYPRSCYYQFLIICVSTFQIIIIKLGGTQYKPYSQRQSIYDAFYRKCLNKAIHKIESPLEAEFIQVYKTLSQPSKHSFLYRVFSKSRLKPGKDFYPLMSGIQLVILLYIFFFYDMMEFQSKNNRKSIQQILTVNQFSKNMMIALFTQSIIMIIDRCIVSFNLIDKKNQALQNFFLNFVFSDHIKYRSPKDLIHIGFFDFLLIIKYLFHLILLIAINFFVYFYIPSSGFKKSLIPQCQNAVCGKSYTFLSIFLSLYLAYFLVSGLQIKHGFNRDKCKNKLMQKYHYINYYIYVLFTGIPFLWEFKKICDWTITSTALPLFHWMKFQDINARLYQSKCQAQMLKIKPRAITPWSKYFLGPSGCLFILALVFSPLLIYSSLNPFAIKDQVIASRIKLSLIVDNNVQYKFFSTSHAIIQQNISKLPKFYSQQIQSSGGNVQKYIGFQDSNQFYLKMSSYPDQNFKLSEPTVRRLINRIQRTLNGKKYRQFDLLFITKINQKEGGERQIQWAKKRLNETQLKEFKQFLQINQTSNYKYFTIENFFSVIPGQTKNQTICMSTKNFGQYYELFFPTASDKTCNIPKNQMKENPGVLLFYKSATKYKIGFGLVTFYVTYVLLISRLFRVYLSGNLQNVIYQGCQFERMLILCDAVRQARILQNLYQEEYLYSFLIDLMKGPRTLKEMSGNFTDLRNKLPLSQKYLIKKQTKLLK